MGYSILELVLQVLREAGFTADVAYPGQKVPRISDTVAAVHIEKVDRANLTVTLGVSILAPASKGGTACEVDALRATEMLRWSGAVCVQNGCRYDGVAQVYVVEVLATFTGVTETDDCKIWPGFYVYINDRLQRYTVAFTDEEQVILLIDEIDKADLEFPNDLLWELDQMEFHIPETGETVKAKQRPIVIITSNAEKELPDAFLRRCVFHYIEFPEQEQMEKIIRVHFDHLEDDLVRQALAAFYWVRELRGIEKKPSTSELVDWLRAMVAGGIDPARIPSEIPFAGVLLKKDKDLQNLRKALR